VHAVDVVFRTLLGPELAASAEDHAPRAPAAQISLAQLLDALSFPHLPTRPYVLLNMISTVDGRATIRGRSGPLGNRADHDLFHGLRTLVDGVLVGAQTLRTERYNRIVADAPSRTRRLARGLGEEPLACIASTSLALDPTIPLLADSDARVALLTPSEGELVPVAARVSYVRAVHDGRLDLAAALGMLRRRFAVRTLLCEGGPHLAGQLIAADLLDELFLTTSPKLVSGEVESDPASALPAAPAGPALSILSGPDLDPPVALELCSLLESESYLFARYRVLH
jgi:riboflavin biosynthesis pyrimidine reductase